jgi:hypothetical protein
LESKLSESFSPAHFIALLERERQWFELLMTAMFTRAELRNIDPKLDDKCGITVSPIAGYGATQLMVDETKTIELWPCGYDARCNVRNCKAKATTLARSVDAGGRPIKQYELCAVHADQVAQREKLKGREIVRRG